jgi:hypothetical protein
MNGSLWRTQSIGNPIEELLFREWLAQRMQPLEPKCMTARRREHYHGTPAGDQVMRKGWCMLFQLIRIEDCRIDAGFRRSSPFRRKRHVCAERFASSILGALIESVEQLVLRYHQKNPLTAEGSVVCLIAHRIASKAHESTTLTSTSYRRPSSHNDATSADEGQKCRRMETVARSQCQGH